MDKIILDWKKYITTLNRAVEEGCVIVRNEKETLPLASKSKIAWIWIILHRFPDGICQFSIRRG